MKRQFSAREWKLLGMLVAILAVSGFVMLFYMPMRDERDNCLSQAESCRAEAEVFQVQLEDKLRMEREMETQTADGKPLLSVPDYDNLQPVIVELNNILAGTDTYSLSFASVDENQSIVRRRISLSYTAGSYDAARAVLQRLHDCAYRCMLDNVSIGFGEGEGGDSDSASVSATIVFFEYRKVEQAAAEGTEGTA